MESCQATHRADGLSVLGIADSCGIDIDGACEGQMACATCHVIVDDPWHDRLPEPSEDEEDMLDLAAGLPDRGDGGARWADGQAAS